MTVQQHKFQWVSGLFDDSEENIVIHTEYGLKVSMVHIISDQWNGVENYLQAHSVKYLALVTIMYCVTSSEFDAIYNKVGQIVLTEWGFFFPKSICKPFLKANNNILFTKMFILFFNMNII